ncbi:MAG: polymer-forming cytoskeletal protein [Ferruginibacter sp.]|nr:polymer-forming cytoskeletal protein [Ferruginibacter sp.]
MFNSKSKLLSDQTSKGSTTIIGAGTVINGDIQSDGDIRIDGFLNGNLHAKAKIFIGPEGGVDGDIHAIQADILGKVTGQLRIKDLLQLLGKCEVEGDIFAGKLQVEPSANFNGSCQMGGSVVELNSVVEINKELGNVVNQ